MARAKLSIVTGFAKRYVEECRGGGACRIPAGPQRALVRQFVDMAFSWSPLDERVLLWTGKPNKEQRRQLHPYLLSVSPTQGRSLLTGTVRVVVSLGDFPLACAGSHFNYCSAP